MQRSATYSTIAEEHEENAQISVRTCWSRRQWLQIQIRIHHDNNVITKAISFIDIGSFLDQKLGDFQPKAETFTDNAQF